MKNISIIELESNKFTKALDEYKRLTHLLGIPIDFFNLGTKFSSIENSTTTRAGIVIMLEPTKSFIYHLSTLRARFIKWFIIKKIFTYLHFLYSLIYYKYLINSNAGLTCCDSDSQIVKKESE